MLKTCHTLYNNPTPSPEALQEKKNRKRKKNSLYWYFLECEGAGRNTRIASIEHTDCKHVQTRIQDFTPTGHKSQGALQHGQGRIFLVLIISKIKKVQK